MTNRFQDDVDHRSAEQCAMARSIRMCFRATIVCLLNAAKGKWRSLVGMLEAEGYTERQIADALFRLYGTT